MCWEGGGFCSLWTWVLIGVLSAWREGGRGGGGGESITSPAAIAEVLRFAV